MPDICIFGDSISYGAWDSEGGWVERLRKYLDTKKKLIPKDDRFFYLVYNFSISGDTTKRLLRRFKYECEAVEELETIIFAIGSNDSSYIDSKKEFVIDIEEFEKNLIRLIKLAKKFTKKIIFIGLTPVNEDETNPFHWNKDYYSTNDNLRKYDNKIKSICKQNNLQYIHMFDKLIKNNLEDGSHPTSRGHQKMFEIIREFLIKNKII